MTIKELIKRSVDNDTNAIYELANAYWTGDKVKKSKTKALELYQKGSELGHKECSMTLAQFYEKGTIVSQNYNIARNYYYIAATQGHKDAMYQLGYYYEFGYGVYKDIEQAIYWYEQSIDVKDAKKRLELLGENNV